MLQFFFFLSLLSYTMLCFNPQNKTQKNTKHTCNHDWNQLKGSTPSNYNSFSSFFQDVNSSRDLHEGILNKEQEDEMFVYGYRKSKVRSFVCYLCIGLTLGILRLVMHWWSHWLLLATHKKCSLREAEKVLIKEEFQGKHSIYYVKTVVTLTSDSIR